VSRLSRETRLIVGRNFIETLILTAMQLELVAPSLELSESVVMRLEEELCAVAYSMPIIKQVYHRTILDIVGEMFPDLPKPDIKYCFAYETLKQWLLQHVGIVMGEKIKYMHTKDVDSWIRRTAIRICRTAIMSVFYKTSIVMIGVSHG